MPRKSLTTLLLTSLLLITFTAQAASDFLVIADFNQGNQNALGGYFNKFEREPSSAVVGLTKSTFRGNTGKSLQIKAKKDPDGFCGAWMHFFDFRADDKQYLNASDYNYLSFWIKGEQGGEKLAVKLADKRLIEIEDSMSVGDISLLLPGGITREWQEVLVPINRLPNIDRNKLGGVTFDFKQQGNYIVYVDDVVLKKTRDVTVMPASATSDEGKASEPALAQSRAIPLRTMWVWMVYQILENKNNEQGNLFDVCKRENINRIWLQIPAQYEPDVDLSQNAKDIQPPKFKISLRHKNKLKAFIRDAHARGIKVEALEGYPEFSQKPYHFIPLAVVDAIIDYNKRAKPEERFDGVHFDNEPYLIIGWHDKERREQILKEFLELNVECQRRIHKNSDMVFGVDIPFWWNAPDPVTKGAIGDVTFNGERKPAAFFCIDLLDNIGIMNYRDTTFGADGIVEHARPILEYAEKAGKDQVYVGLEIFRYMPTEVYFPFGLPRKQFHEVLRTKADKYSYLSRINGFRTQLLDDGVNVHVGIELPVNPDEKMQEKIYQTVAEIGRYLGIKSYKDPSTRDIKKMVMYAQREIEKNPEWTDYQFAEIVDAEMLQLYPGFKAVSIMLGKTTFADESYDEFKSQLEASESELINFPAYTGTALHYFKVLDEKFYEKPKE